MRTDGAGGGGQREVGQREREEIDTVQYHEAISTGNRAERMNG